MARKIFYMIRHGESLLNAAHIRQGSEGSLSPKGQEQAANAGKRLARHTRKFDAVLVSPFTRTQETAAIICQYVKSKKPVEYVDLLTERRNPSEIINQSATDPVVKQIVDRMDLSFHEDNYRYSDEENFQDLKERAEKLLKYLAHRPEKKILIVTHSIFLKMIASYIIYRDKLDAHKYNLLSYTNASSNASTTVCEYNSGWLGDGRLGRKYYPIEKRWKLVKWDDYTV